MDAKLTSGAVFAGRFRVGEVISVDGTGAFHRAVETASGNAVSLRTFAPQLKLVPREIAALQARVAALAPFRHPRAVVPTEVIEEGNVVATVAPAFEGRSLGAVRQAARGGFMDLSALEVPARSVADTMNAAHAAGIIHGGLRPGNIFVDPDGRASIADFGIGAIVSAIVARAGGAALKSEIETYISNAQGRGEGPYMTDDVFAFGAIVFEALTGDVPYPATRKFFLSRKQQPRSRSKMSERRAERGVRGAPIPMTWERLVFTCLDRDGFARPQRFGTVVRLLPPLTSRTKVKPAATPAAGESESVGQTRAPVETARAAATTATDLRKSEEDLPVEVATGVEPAVAARESARIESPPSEETAPEDVPAAASLREDKDANARGAATDAAATEAIAHEREHNAESSAVPAAEETASDFTALAAQHEVGSTGEPAEQIAAVSDEDVVSEESSEPVAATPEPALAPEATPALARAASETQASESEALAESASDDEKPASAPSRATADEEIPQVAEVPVAASIEQAEQASNETVAPPTSPRVEPACEVAASATEAPPTVGPADVAASTAPAPETPEKNVEEKKVAGAVLGMDASPATPHAVAAHASSDDVEAKSSESTQAREPAEAFTAADGDEVLPPPPRKLRLKKPLKTVARSVSNGASSHPRKPASPPPEPGDDRDDPSEDREPALPRGPERKYRPPPGRFDAFDRDGSNPPAPGLEETRRAREEGEFEQEEALTGRHQTAGNAAAFAPPARPQTAPSRARRPRTATEELTDEFWGTEPHVAPVAPRAAQPRPHIPAGGGGHGGGRYGGPEPAHGTRWSVVFLRTMAAVLVLGLIGTGVLYFAIERERRSGGSELAETIREIPSQASAAFTRATVAVLGEEPRLNSGENAEQAAAAARARQVRALDEAPPAPRGSAAPVQAETPVAGPSPAGSSGSIAVRTVPFGAMVEVGGLDPQPGPIMIDGLPPGSYEVSVSAPGYARYVSRVEIDGTNRSSLDVVLERQMGTASIGSQPLGRAFEIFASGGQTPVEAGTTPRSVALPAGVYEVVFSTPGGGTVRKPLTVVTGGTVLVSADLSSPPAAVVARDTVTAPPPQPVEAPVPARSGRAAPETGSSVAAVASQEDGYSPEPAGVSHETSLALDAEAPAVPAPAPGRPEFFEPALPAEVARESAAAEARTAGEPIPTPPMAEAPGAATHVQPGAPRPAAAAPVDAVDSTPLPPAASGPTATGDEVSRELPPATSSPVVLDSSAGVPPVEEPKLYSLSEVDDKPLLLERRNPVVPRRFNRVNGEGRVQLTIIIDRDGRVSSARVDASTDDRLASACLEAVRFWKFSPPRKDSQQVAVRVAVPFVFK